MTIIPASSFLLYTLKTRNRNKEEIEMNIFVHGAVLIPKRPPATCSSS